MQGMLAIHVSDDICCAEVSCKAMTSPWLSYLFSTCRLYTGIHALKPKNKSKSGAIFESTTALNVGQSNTVLSENTPLASAVIYLCCGRYNNDIFISARFNRCPVELKKKSEEDEQWERHLMSGGLCSLLGQTVCASHASFFFIDGLFISC